MKNRTIAIYLLTMLFIPVYSGQAVGDRKTVDEDFLYPTNQREKGKSSWAFAIDNDILVPVSRDQDYTYGFSLTLSGDETDDGWTSVHRPLDWINDGLGLHSRFSSGIAASKVEYGLFGFTPEDITLADPQPTDRPYSSLVYLSSTRESYDRDRQVSRQSTLTLGVLGLDLVGDIQNSVHAAFDGKSPRGWGNQISDGGEPTVRYVYSRQALRYRSDDGFEVKSTLQASVGYLTETSWSLSMRRGRIQTPWLSFNPELTSYGEKSVPNSRVRISEQYGWAGLSIKLRAYNAFLQGQFKDSAVTYDSHELNHLILEAWLGYTLALNNGYSFTYSIRGHTSELHSGIGDRSVFWGGVLISRTLG